MTTDIVEGEVTEVEPIKALVVQQPGQVLISETYDAGPDRMIETASRLAGALKDIVEQQHLYAVISGKKFPQVEAWMTIGRLDNVVAREAERPIRNDDGSYEGFVELVRLSDGMVIGRASALCGTPDDRPWATRAEPARRSMAVTRATSRAFRQQYSWIMALAGYEATPAEEMHDTEQRPIGTHDSPPPRPELDRPVDGLIGVVAKGKTPVDMEMRQTPDGMAWGFKLTVGRKGYQVLALGDLATALSAIGLEVGARVQCWGEVVMVPWQKDDKDMPPYARVNLARIKGDEFEMPAAAEVRAFSPDELDGIGPDNTAAGHEHWADT